MSGGPFSILGSANGVDYMDAMANPQLARQYTGQQPRGILSQISDALVNNSGLLMGYGSGGFEGAAQGMQVDERTRLIKMKQAEEERLKVARQQAAQKLGIDPILAEANPEIIATVASRKYAPKEYSLDESYLRNLQKTNPEQFQQAMNARVGLGSKTTDDQRELAQINQERAARGLGPLYMEDFLQTKKPGTTVNIDNKGESTEVVEKTKEDVKYLSGLAAEAPKVAQRSADLNFLGGIIARTPTGSGAELRAQLDGIGSKLGMSPGTLKSQADAIKAVTNRLAPSLRAPGSGSQSDAELAGFLAALPNLAADPKANQLIQASLQRAAAIDRERTKVASQYRAGRITRQQAMGQLADLDEQSIYASPEEKKLVENIMGGQPLSGGGQSGNWEIIGVK